VGAADPAPAHLPAVVFTNLTLYTRHGERLAGADLIDTSLYGDAAAHTAARGAGAHAGVLEAIAELRRRGTPLVAICVVTELVNRP
jgi:MoaA/NifB/PqqE/SkfB family radical SAM enzyme